VNALTELIDLGADLSSERQISHFVTVPKEGSANALATELARRGYEASSVEDATSDRWFVIAARVEVVDASTLAAVQAELAMLLEAIDGSSYERWDADLTEAEEIGLPS
jgi:regulator of RNase E activity RraB